VAIGEVRRDRLAMDTTLSEVVDIARDLDKWCACSMEITDEPRG
jgi:hypothetical protein